MASDSTGNPDTPRERGGWLSRVRADASPPADRAQPPALTVPGSREEEGAQATDLAGVVLRGAAALVGRGWCQGEDAVDPAGAAVAPWDASAVRWSIGGAMDAVRQALDRAGHPAEVLRSGFERAELALAATVGEDLAAWNDSPERTWAETLEAFDPAIERAEKLRQRLARSLTAELPTTNSPPPAPARPQLPGFDLRRRELDRFLGDFDQDMWRHGLSGGRTPGKAASPMAALADMLTRPEPDSDSAARRSAQVIAGVVIQGAETRLRTFASVGARLSEREREILAGLLRLPAQERLAFATVLRLANADRAEIATALGLSDPECHALAFVLSDTYPANVAEPAPDAAPR